MNTNDNGQQKFIIDQCLNTLKREDVKKEFLIFLKPILVFIIIALQPYLYIILLNNNNIPTTFRNIGLLLHGKFFKTRLQ